MDLDVNSFVILFAKNLLGGSKTRIDPVNFSEGQYNYIARYLYRTQVIPGDPGAYEDCLCKCLQNKPEVPKSDHKPILLLALLLAFLVSKRLHQTSRRFHGTRTRYRGHRVLDEFVYTHSNFLCVLEVHKLLSIFKAFQTRR